MNRELIVTSDLPNTACDIFLREQPRAILLSGGDTPGPTYSRLAQLPYDWGNAEFFFCDERCVPPNHEDSNYRLAWETLLSKVSSRVHRMHGEACDAQGYEQELRSIFGDTLPSIDFAFMGIGADGHTASLFPGDPALDETERWVLRVIRPDHPRLTLTLPVLSAVKVALFLVSGAEKKEALKRMLDDEDVPAARVAAPRVIVVADPSASPARS